jgi:predicted DNA-binding transcriptional regulator YafY
MLALTTGRELLRGLAGTVFHEAAVSALDKIRQALPPELATRSQAADRAVSGSTGPTHDYRARGGVVNALVRAIDRQQTVEIDYRKRGGGPAERRRLDPYHLHVIAGAIYVVGYCHTREALRIFLVDRADAVTATGERFERRPDIVPAAVLHGSFGPWSGEPVRVQLRFSSEVASLVAERRMHPSQSSQWRADRRLDVSLHVPKSPALVAWIVSWGPWVEVLAPASIRDTVRKQHEAAARVMAKRNKKTKSTRRYVTKDGDWAG